MQQSPTVTTLFWRLFALIFHSLVTVIEYFYHRHIPHLWTQSDIDRVRDDHLLWSMFEKRLRSHIDAFGFWDSARVHSMIIDDDTVFEWLANDHELSTAGVAHRIAYFEYCNDVKYILIKKYGVSHDRANYLAFHKDYTACTHTIEDHFRLRNKPSQAAHMIADYVGIIM